MRPLSVSELLTVWERGFAALPFERALAILSLASPESSPGALARLSIGRRDANLLQLREWAFGSELAMMAGCPSCGQALELTMPVAELRFPHPAGIPLMSAANDLESSLMVRDYQVRYRSPNTEDVAGCAGLELAACRRKLLACCVTEARHQGKSVSAEDLPEDVAQNVEEQIAAIDPQIDMRLDLTCPECHQRWKEVFDIVSFFCTEIDAWARRVLREVDVLARAYGWRESDILALSPVRRQIYMAMAQV
ncbi:MAG TPA: hypothetical protein VK788_25390 [Terriglobales bacterium]|jgi:hypothetical protein|nr:hypothetical protein [Terriglobales bacterium]